LSRYPARQFALFRIVLGLFLAQWFARLVPFAEELFGPTGLFPHWPRSPLPNVFRLELASQPGFARALVAGLALASLLFAFGVARRVLAVCIWYGLSCLTARHFGILNPSLPYLGWLLLASALVPRGEGLSLRGAAADPAWRMPPLLFHGAWWIMALAYTASGWDKLSSLGWRNGTAAAVILGLPFARDTFLRELVLALPAVAIRLLTWSALATELLFAPMCLWRPTRILAWCAAVGLHLGLLALLDFADISVAMLMIHVFTFDVRWWTERPVRGLPPAPSG
jgi:hypothetical protein